MSLKREKYLKRNVPLRSRTPLRRSKALNQKNNIKGKTAISQRHHSVITDDLSHSYVSGLGAEDGFIIDVHHIFGGSANRKISEEFGFVVALTRQEHEELHRNPNSALDLVLKKQAQAYYLTQVGGTKEEFRLKFGKMWD